MQFPKGGEWSKVNGFSHRQELYLPCYGTNSGLQADLSCDHMPVPWAVTEIVTAEPGKLADDAALV